MEIGPIRNQNLILWPLANVLEKLTRDNKKNRPHQPTIKFTGFLPINFLPLPAPPNPRIAYFIKFYLKRKKKRKQLGRDKAMETNDEGVPWSEEEFSLARTTFESTSAVLKKLVQAITKIADSFKGKCRDSNHSNLPHLPTAMLSAIVQKVSMWAVIDLSGVLEEFLGSGPTIELEGSMNEYMV